MPKLKRTLYIGLGGTGFKTLLHTKKAFIETYGEVPPMIRFLAIDSDQNQYQTYTLPSIHGEVKFDPAESSDIMVPSARQTIELYRNIISWLPERNLLAVQDLCNGCGMVRTNGRVAFSLNYNKTRQNIQNAINQISNLKTILDDRYQLLSQDIEVNIVFSIAGGTGSGNFLDTAYMVKDIMREQAIPETSKIIGYMVLPDVYEAQLRFGRDKLFPNGCASLVDLDYLMHSTQRFPVNYFNISKTLDGSPFNAILAISNRNQNGDVVDNSDDLSEMMSLAMVVSAGELSGGMNSIANNFERDLLAGEFNVENKRAILGTLGMSAITFRAKELSKLFKEKAALETAKLLLNPNQNMDAEANTWIDNNSIRENNGQDQVIDYLLSKVPTGPVLQEISDDSNPQADIDNYKSTPGIAVNTNTLNKLILEKEDKVKSSLDEKINNLLDSQGPASTLDFIKYVKGEIDECMNEMRQERQGFINQEMAKESAITVAIEEYKHACDKIFGRKSAKRDAIEILSNAAKDAAINNREIHRRNGAITFYTWLIAELNAAKEKVTNILDVVSQAKNCLDQTIIKTNRDLIYSHGLFEVDLTQPYINKVSVPQNLINLNQLSIFINSNNKAISSFNTYTPIEVVDCLISYASTLNINSPWEGMSVEDALENLGAQERKSLITRAISLSSPMCPLDFRGYISKMLNNYYFIGVEEQSSTKLNNNNQNCIIDIDGCIPAGQPHETVFASTGSKDRIVIYHQYGVFPTFAIAGTAAYRQAHDNYLSRPTSYSCFIDEDLRIKMDREGFSVIPKERSDNSTELWVKGLIFQLIKRDENGVYYYKDLTNRNLALDEYWASLDTKFRDEAFKKFKREAMRLQPQYEEYLANRKRVEGSDAINSIIADAKNNYLQKFSLNELTREDLNNPLYSRIKDQLTSELNFVKEEL